jgi:pimeloyl-ACP methyl ester carboxylesterase
MIGRAGAAITIMVHGGSGGEWFWREPRRSVYDHAYQMALLGHAALAIAGIGYPPSDLPPGNQVCDGSSADALHQLVTALRHGRYHANGFVAAPRFDRVAIAGLSGGGAIAHVEAYSFRDIDGLVVVGFADQTSSLLTPSLFLRRWLPVCARGGVPQSANPSAPRGYVYSWPSIDQEVRDWLFDAAPEAVAAIRTHHFPEPCGLALGLPSVAVLDSLYLRKVDAPVLLVYGREDRAVPPPAGGFQRLRYTGSPSVTLRYLENTGHVVNYDSTAPAFRQVLASWLSSHDL